MRQAMVFFLLLALAAISGGQAAAAKDEGAQLSRVADQGSVLQYKEAKNFFSRLEEDQALAQDRQNWLNGIRNFRKIYLADTKAALAPSCLFMMGRMYHRMYQLFRQPLDLDEAISYFNDVASLFPENSLADDALLAVAEIWNTEKNNPERAAEVYSSILKQYPGGDKKETARLRLNELSRNGSAKTGVSQQPNSLQHLVTVLPVRYWSSDDYTRIVIRASSPVKYTACLLEKNNNQPRRLYIDFAQSYIPSRYRSPIPIQDGLLKQVRTGQFNATTVRVVLDIESISSYKIFSLNDPFRVVVDVHGKKKKGGKAGRKLLTAGSGEKKVDQQTRPTGPQPFVVLEDNKKVRVVEAAGPAADNKEDNLSLAQQLGLGVRRIVIDPGHGGRDPGALAYGLKEKDVVLRVARRIAALLRETYGYEVILTRDKDVYLPLEERTAIANTSKADIFLSIHVNAHPNKKVRGIETFFLNLATNTDAMRVAARENATSTHNISELQDILSDLMQNSKIQESSILARYIHEQLVSGLSGNPYRIRDLGVKQAPFYVLIGAEMPAVLAEISFITNPHEAALLKEDSYLNEIALQIATGVARYVDHHSSAAALQF